MSKVIYHCSEDHHNKTWSYEITGNSVYVEWSRVGGTLDSQTKTFSSSYEVTDFISKKVREKEKKGYKLTSQKAINKETKTAQAIGAQNKIAKMQWVSRKDNLLTQIDAYDPKQYVYVEILNSWSKKVTRLLLQKETTWMVSGDSVSVMGRTMSVDGLTKLGYSSFAETVRGVLKEMAEVVSAALQTIKFGAAGVRDLFGDGTAPVAKEYQDAIASIDTSNFDMSVISKFASLGARTLEL